MLDAGKFRSDLYYRLSVLMLNLPPLRERQEDIPLLCRYFLKLHTPKTALSPSFTPGALRQLCEWPWRGNIREMQNVMIRVATTVREHLVEKETIRDLLEGTLCLGTDPDFSQGREESIRQALAKAGGKKGKAAATLGMSRTTLWRKMREIEM
ncbi:helix-turn-helix domain-containing protein [Sodalis ligni]|uniref:helix-turn-helix domain-containing protein n=1 Tax=Sodalis ligni TaxID=2697027 RepID=UPI0020984FC4|nr:helix-turn-helix domain-containing protein [Sodalis ligni]